MSGVRGALDDASPIAGRAYGVAGELADALTDAAYAALDIEPASVLRDLNELTDLAEQLRGLAENLAAKIEQQRAALRRG